MSIIKRPYRVPVTKKPACTDCGLSWALSRHTHMCIMCDYDTHVLCTHCFNNTSPEHQFKIVRVDLLHKEKNEIPENSKLRKWAQTTN